MRITFCIAIDLTADELAVLRILRGARVSDRRVAEILGCSLETTRRLVWGLRRTLGAAPGERIVEAASRHGL